MSLSLMWSIMFFMWVNILVFIGVCTLILRIMHKPFGFKETTSLCQNNIKTPEHGEINPYFVDLEDSTDNTEYTEYNSEREEEEFLGKFGERIQDLKDELEVEYLDGISDDLKDNFFEYDEEDMYMPDMYSEGTGVEIITDEYEKSVEKRLK